MITTLSHLTDTVQEAEAEGWKVAITTSGKIQVYPANRSLGTMSRIALVKDGMCQTLDIAPWVDPAKMVRRTRT